MQWKEALSIKNREGKINQEIYEALLRLPEIINRIFILDYEKHGYEACEPIYHEFGMASAITATLRTYISSNSANRTLLLSYIFMKNNYELGIISDNIRIADAVSGWGTSAYLNLIASNRGIDIGDKKYNIPEIYEGSALEKLEACLKQIKLKYDTIAPDIINGENWDDHAWNIGGQF